MQIIKINTLTTTLCLLAVSVATAQAPTHIPLDSQRWSERKYGISILPPIGTKIFLDSMSDNLVRIRDIDKRYQITVAVKRSTRALSLEEVVASAKQQVKYTHPHGQLLIDEPWKIADRSARIMYYRLQAAGQHDLLLGQAIVAIAPTTYAVVELNGSGAHAELLRPTFEAVLGSMEIADQQKLSQMRAAAIARSVQWRSTLNPRDEVASVQPEQFFRIMRDKQDIGWMRIKQRYGTYNNRQGLQVTIHTHLEIGTDRFDTVADYFRPEKNREQEIWSVRSSRRPVVAQRANERVETVLETGSGTLSTVQVVIDYQAGRPDQELKFPRPQNGYLAQADAWILHRVLPHDTPAEYGFYWYNSNLQKITYRTDRVTPTLDGYVVHSRTAPDLAELVSRYDARGELLERDLGQGQKMVRSDLNTLKTIWNIR